MYHGVQILPLAGLSPRDVFSWKTLTNAQNDKYGSTSESRTFSFKTLKYHREQKSKFKVPLLKLTQYSVQVTPYVAKTVSTVYLEVETGISTNTPLRTAYASFFVCFANLTLTGFTRKWGTSLELSLDWTVGCLEAVFLING